MGTDNLASVIEKLKSDLVRSRTEGLDDLQRIFDPIRGSSIIDSLRDDDFHLILESLFAIVRQEKAAYLRTSKALTRLTKAATTFKRVVEDAAPKLKQKTATAVLEHIIDTLPTSDGSYCKPLQNAYLRSFRSILEFAPRGEHLRPKQWQTYTDFVVGGIATSISKDSEDASSTPLMSSTSGTSISIRTTQSSNVYDDRDDQSTTPLDDLLTSLTYLTSISNAPLLTRLIELSDVLVDSIQTMARSRRLITMTHLQELAFECMNNILPRALTENIKLAARMFDGVYPSIKHFWGARPTVLKEHMLVTLSLSRHLYLNASWEPYLVQTDVIEQLLDSLMSEYRKSAIGDLLQLDDLNFYETRNPPPISLIGIHPNSVVVKALEASRKDAARKEPLRSDAAWSTLSVCALLVIALEKRRTLKQPEGQEEGPRKRRKVENSIEDIFSNAVAGTGKSRTVALQLALFVVDHQNSASPKLLRLLGDQRLAVNEEDNAILCWSFLLLARCAQLPDSTSSEAKDVWQNVWKSASQAVSNTICSRTACHLLEKMLEGGLMNNVLTSQALCESIFPDGLNGPASLSDASLALITRSLSSGLLENEKVFKYFASRTLSWLDLNWTFPSALDRGQRKLAAFVQPQPICQLLTALANGSSTFKLPKTLTQSNMINQALLLDRANLKFVDFMLQDGDSPAEAKRKVDAPSSSQPTRSTFVQSLAASIADMLFAKLKSFSSSWDDMVIEKASNISIEMAEIMTTACVLSAAFSTIMKLEHHHEASKDLVAHAFRSVCVLAKERSGDEFRNIVVRIGGILLQLKSNNAVDQQILSDSRVEMISALTKVLKEEYESQENGTMVEDEFFDSINTVPSQSSQSRTAKILMFDDRYDIPVSSNPQALFPQVQMLMMLLDSTRSQLNSLSDHAFVRALIDHTIDLEPQELLASRDIVLEFLSSDMAISKSDACRLLERIGEVCLQDDNLERCETALCFCLRAMMSLLDMWVTDEDDELANIAYDIYNWYSSVALGKGIASERVLVCMAQMLEAVLQKNPSYSINSLPSARTNLLSILKSGCNAVKFTTAPLLLHIFDGYVLAEHDAVFDDIVENLPTDPDNKEGIAARLYVLALSGARWHTVLRQAVYHIFETTSKVPATIVIAKKCVGLICSSLSIAKPQNLLQLFSAQILYTWLENESFDAIPFAAFGYPTLVALLKDVQAEIVPQVAMRMSSDHAQIMAQYLNEPWKDQIIRFFAKCIAYTAIADISLHRSSESQKAEQYVREQMGEESYNALLLSRIPEVVCELMLRLSDDRGFEKSFSDDEEGRNPIVSAWNLIRSKGSSSLLLPPCQQPSFRAKHLPYVLNKVCTDAGVSFEGIWTPSLVVRCYRSLLDDAKPAFGPLHACAILRKIRIVVCLAGPVALSGYPLEMLLHNLRPFLTQFHCSEDAFGIFWYLLEQGKGYLSTCIPFVTGLSVAVFTALSRFVTSSQDSTTQESHFMSTISKAQEFRMWLGEYLSTFDTSKLSRTGAETFTNIVQSAREISKVGSSTKDTPEGNLLYHLLVDQASGQPLLAQKFFLLTLRSLCSQFQVAEDPSDDILSTEQDVTKIASVLKRILDVEIQDTFRIWAAGHLGRAYASQGPRAMEAVIDDNKKSLIPQSLNMGAQDSYHRLTDLLIDLLWEEDERSASAAEHTLQLIFSLISPKDRFSIIHSPLDERLFHELRFEEFQCPDLRIVTRETSDGEILSTWDTNQDSIDWASQLTLELCRRSSDDAVLSSLTFVLHLVPALASKALPSIIHLVLLSDLEQGQKLRESLSLLFSKILEESPLRSENHARLILNIMLYLRSCTLPSESTMAKRNIWLAVDAGIASKAALQCKMYHTALLLLEVYSSQHALSLGRSLRRSTADSLEIDTDLVSNIYQSVDDPDFFYGTLREIDVPSIVSRLSHEGFGQKALSFQSAIFDSNIRIGGMDLATNAAGNATVSALSLANLHGLATSFSQSNPSQSADVPVEHAFASSMNLHQWDIWQNESTPDSNGMLLDAFRTAASSHNKHVVMEAADSAILKVLGQVLNNNHYRSARIQNWSSLAVLSELKETIAARSMEDLESLIDNRSLKHQWIERESFDSVEKLLLGREATLAMIKSNATLKNALSLTSAQSLLLEIKTMRASLKSGHSHEMSQFCLNRATYLSELIPSTIHLGIPSDAAIQYDLANTLWAQDEVPASIRVLQALHSRTDLAGQAIEISESEILAELGQKLTQARLERPDEVTSRYLIPAIKALGKQTAGANAGRVFHNFASFCDGQLRDPDNDDEYRRIEKIRDRKWHEVIDLETMLKSAEGKTRDQLKQHHSKAKTWFKLDDEEWQRAKSHREKLIQRCLENYLLSLRACEDFPNDVLRFLALWLEQAASPEANTSVNKYLATVPTYKFAPLMNQLASRILDEKNPFQHLLFDLMFRICNEHPFHSLYQVFAASKSRPAKEDEVATSRHAAANKLADTIMKKGAGSPAWVSIHNSSIAFVRVAQEKIADKEVKTGSKIALRKLPQGAKLEQTIQDLHLKLPPPTMNTPLRPDKNYLPVPKIARFDPLISIAGGVSAPKIVTVIATDGSRHKMLLKGGNDDLRQDSIMEQVFEQVSNLLQVHRTTRQRKLGIRTYKVIPLTHNAGVIEFVRDTIPLHDFVLPAHTRYFPKDFKPNKCRKEIGDAQTKPLNQRLQAYRNVVANFHPVMRFFFMEHFLDPDDWFEKRLNYSRSTAAISMLGHVLGLGDRHGHNILLDQKTGEVVHIDLGVAFEAGRVLPVPEVVPFRLTRDLVDGMGLSGVEGVFRRCCNFTLEALRQNQEAIMTILDVLRWDPLYSWSISPLRLQRMQDNQDQQTAHDTTTTGASNTVGNTTATDPSTTTPIAGGMAMNGGGGAVGAAIAAATAAKVATTKFTTGTALISKRDVNEPSEADRALSIVAKKLGKSLSVEATVNELIRQATDERNLAVLYCGWAAYA